MRTDSSFVDEIHEILEAPRYTDVIDALRPNSTFVLDVSTPALTDVFIEAGGDFVKFLKRAIYRVIREKRGSDYD